MAPQLTREQVAHIAGLAELNLSASELDTFTHQLADILAYAAQVQLVDTAGVPAFDAGAGLDARAPGGSTAGATALRSDRPAPSLDRAIALANAPDAASEAGLFRVPKVL
jgi:aspartyl-tRNA(Asn)/glutamyl-tRNA(Gln) amidotransferase subunit C